MKANNAAGGAGGEKGVLGMNAQSLVALSIARSPAWVFQLELSDYYPEYWLVCQAIPSTPLLRAEGPLSTPISRMSSTKTESRSCLCIT